MDYAFGSYLFLFLFFLGGLGMEGSHYVDQADPPALASRVQGLQAYTTTLAFF
jgi:hypothetical protein